MAFTKEVAKILSISNERYLIVTKDSQIICHSRFAFTKDSLRERDPKPGDYVFVLFQDGVFFETRSRLIYPDLEIDEFEIELPLLSYYKIQAGDKWVWQVGDTFSVQRNGTIYHSFEDIETALDRFLGHRNRGNFLGSCSFSDENIRIQRVEISPIQEGETVVSLPKDPILADYLEQNGYKEAADKLR